MSRLHLNDRAPGAKIERFCLPKGALILIMRIASQTRTAAPRLFMRCEEDGQMFVAIEKAEQVVGSSDE